MNIFCVEELTKEAAVPTIRFRNELAAFICPLLTKKQWENLMEMINQKGISGMKVLKIKMSKTEKDCDFLDFTEQISQKSKTLKTK